MAAFYNFGASSAATYRTAIYASQTALTGATPALSSTAVGGTYRVTLTRPGVDDLTITGPLSNIQIVESGNQRVTFFVGTYSAFIAAFGTSNIGTGAGTIALERQTSPGGNTITTHTTRFARRRDLTVDRYINAWDTDANPNTRKFEKISDFIGEDGQFMLDTSGETMEAD